MLYILVIVLFVLSLSMNMPVFSSFLIMLALSLYMLKNRAKSTNNQSDESSDTFKNYGTFFARERWMLDQSEQLKKEREEKKELEEKKDNNS